MVLMLEVTFVCTIDTGKQMQRSLPVLFIIQVIVHTPCFHLESPQVNRSGERSKEAINGRSLYT